MPRAANPRHRHNRKERACCQRLYHTPPRLAPPGYARTADGPRTVSGASLASRNGGALVVHADGLPGPHQTALVRSILTGFRHVAVVTRMPGGRCGEDGHEST